jgi:tRNA modification GTPase
MIVTPHAGTTRDSVSEAICLAGISITLSDTAGLRSDPDPIEDMGIRHTRRLIDSADVLALTLDASSPLDENDLMAIDACERKAAVIVLNKTDLPAHQGPDAFARERGAAVRVSAALGTGIDLLEEALRSAAPDPSAVGDRAALSRRGLACAESAAARLETLVDSITHGGLLSYDIAALEIHGVLESLEEITGESADHGVLDRIFERFCVGK